MGWLSDRLKDIGDSISSAVQSIGDAIEDVASVVETAIEDAIQLHLDVIEFQLDLVDDALQSILGEYQQFGDTSSSLLIQELPDPLRQTVVSAVLNDRNIASSITDLLLNGYRGNVERYWRYGVSQYELGLPQASLSTSGAAEDALRIVIEESVRNYSIQIESSSYDVALPGKIIIPWLVRNRSYDPNSKIIFNYRPLNINLSSYVDNYNYPNSEYGAITPSIVGGVKFLTALAAGGSLINITYGYTVLYSRPGVTQRGVRRSLEGIPQYAYLQISETVNVPEYVPGDSYYYVTYRLVLNNGTPLNSLRYWVHNATTTPYSSLRSVSLSNTTNSYYPIVPLRNLSRDLTSEVFRENSLYESSKKLLNIINLNIDELAESLNVNPDIDRIYSAYVLFAADLADDFPIIIKYFFHFFEDLISKSRFSRQDYIQYVQRPSNSAPPFNSIEVKEAGYQMILMYLFVHKRTVRGRVLEVGEYSKEVILQQDATVYNEGIPVADYDTNSLILRHQINAGQYEELIIQSPVHITKLIGNEIIPGTVSTGEDNLSQVSTTLSDLIEFGDSKKSFIIPLDRYIVKNNFTLQEENELFYRTLRITYNTYFEREVRWYETGVFQDILVVVSVVLVIVSAGSLATAVAAAFSAGGIAAATWILLVSIVQALTISLAIQELANYVDVNILAAIAVIASIYGVAKPGAVLISGSVAGAPFSVDLLAASNAALAEAQNQNNQELEDLLQESKDYEKKYEELIADKEVSITLDPLEAIGIFTSSPHLINNHVGVEEYIDTKIHSNNIGVLSIDAISKYVDIALNLNKQII